MNYYSRAPRLLHSFVAFGETLDSELEDFFLIRKALRLIGALQLLVEKVDSVVH